MANITITNNDLGSLILRADNIDDDVFTAGGAVTYKEGTILARDSVSLKLVPYVTGGATNENGIPKAVLPYEVVATGAGDIPVRALFAGLVRFDKLVVHADGNNTNVTKAVRDRLRDYAIESLTSRELNVLDNQ